MEEKTIAFVKANKEEIETELKELNEALEKGFITKKNKMVQDLLKVYGHLKHGGKILDIHEVFKKVELDDNDDPKLAIVRADAKQCYLYKKNNGGAFFTKENRSWRETWSPRKGYGDIALPTGTFSWLDELTSETRLRQTLVPMIPPRVHLAVSCRIMPQHYHILFETESWCKATPIPPKDPILGRMLTKNLFGVLATWELTDLEAKIVEGRL